MAACGMLRGCPWKPLTNLDRPWQSGLGAHCAASAHARLGPCQRADAVVAAGEPRHTVKGEGRLLPGQRTPDAADADQHPERFGRDAMFRAAGRSVEHKGVKLWLGLVAEDFAFFRRRLDFFVDRDDHDSAGITGALDTDVDWERGLEFVERGQLGAGRRREDSPISLVTAGDCQDCEASQHWGWQGELHIAYDYPIARKFASSL
jgi:hypothetical protein